MNIINGSGSFEEKEKELQKLSSYKKVFENVYPGLRTAKTEVLTVKPKKSNPEIAVLGKSIANGEAEVDALSNEELMFSATLTPSLAEKAAIYKAAADNTGSWEAHNNLGATYVQMAIEGDDSKLDDAITQLEIAANKNGSADEVKANLAAAQTLQSEYEQAYATLNGISGASNDIAARVSGMKGALEVRMAEYDKAKASFASAQLDDAANIDKGLAFLLSGDYSQANAAFSEVSDQNGMDGLAYYLMAVAAARANDAAGIGSNLQKAIAADPSFKDAALNDLEFVNFADAVNEAAR
jgi:tetratricopeptide (TPR) repeat protein